NHPSFTGSGLLFYDHSLAGIVFVTEAIPVCLCLVNGERAIDQVYQCGRQDETQIPQSVVHVIGAQPSDMTRSWCSGKLNFLKDDMALFIFILDHLVTTLVDSNIFVQLSGKICAHP